MREIKFRAWIPSRKQMLPVDIEQGRAKFGHTLFNDDIVMQYTGLKDKNGKEIYEGDIVKCNPSWTGKGHERGVIVWEKQRGGFMVNVGRTTAQGFKGLKMSGATHKEVIGNIYENPELLTKE